MSTPLYLVANDTHVKKSNGCGDVVLVVFDWLLSRFTDGLQGSDVNDTPYWVAFLLVMEEDGFDISSVLQVAWEDFDDGIIAVLLRGTLGELVQCDLGYSRESGRVGVAEAETDKERMRVSEWLIMSSCSFPKTCNSLFDHADAELVGEEKAEHDVGA